MEQGRHTLRSISDPVYPPPPAYGGTDFLCDTMQSGKLMPDHCHHNSIQN